VSQRVKIQYTVDLDELHVEVHRLIDVAFNKLSSQSTSCCIGKDEDVLSPKMIDKIEDIRRTLADVDYSLNDITEMINSYLLFRNHPSSSDTESAIESPGIDPAALAEKLSSFKKMMSSQGLPDEVSD